MKLYTFTLKLDCPSCGQMVPVNGPAQGTTCNACHKRVALTPARWGLQISRGTEGMRIINSDYTCIDVGDGDPACPKCDKHFPFDPAWIGQDRDIPCPHCGFAVTTFPAPEWLKAEIPAAAQLVGADRPTDAGEAPIVQPDEGATRPVMLSCPNCAAALKITAACERTTACEHCGVDVYLPDGIWNRLHPVQTVHPWTIVYEGQLETAEELQEEQDRAEQEIAEKEERIQNAIAQAAVMEEEQRKESKKTTLFVVALFSAISAILVATVLMFLFADHG